MYWVLWTCRSIFEGLRGFKGSTTSWFLNNILVIRSIFLSPSRSPSLFMVLSHTPLHQILSSNSVTGKMIVKNTGQQANTDQVDRQFLRMKENSNYYVYIFLHRCLWCSVGSWRWPCSKVRHDVIFHVGSAPWSVQSPIESTQPRRHWCLVVTL